MMNFLRPIVLFLALLSLSMCGDPLEDLKLQVATDQVLKYNMNIELINANRAEDLPSDIEIEVSGADAGNVLDVSGNIPEMADGLVSLTLMPGVTPSPENPIKFTLKAKAEGYIDLIRTVVWEDTSDIYHEFGMLKIADLPPTMGHKKQTFAAAVNPVNGATINPIEATVEATADKPLKVEVQIEEGTIMYDENGQAVNGTNLEVELVQYTDLDEEALNAFSGGFTIENAVDSEGNPMDALEFNTAGMVKIDMHVDGTEVKQFSKPVNVTMELNSETQNPDTDYAPIAEGDVIPVWSRDDQTGQWTQEGDVTVSRNANTGTLEARLQIEHLSFWNLDWWWWRSCTSTLTVTSNLNRFRGMSRYYFELINARNGRVMRRGFNTFFNSQRMVFWRAPQGVNFKLRIYSGNRWWDRGQMIAESNTFSSCGNGSINVQLPVENMIQITAIGRCSNFQDTELRPTLGLWYMRTFTWRGRQFKYRSYLGRMYNGNLVLNGNMINVNQTYEFRTFYDRRWFNKEFTLGSSNLEFDLELPQSFCDQLR